MRANRPPTGADAARQLELFDGTLGEPGRARDELPVARDRPRRSDANLEAVPIESAEPSEPAGGGPHAGADRATLAALEATLVGARCAADDRPALVVLASRLRELGTPPVWPAVGGLSLRQARDDWLRRLEAQQKSESAIVAYRVAIDDLLEWSEANRRNVLEEATIVDYLRSYQQRAGPAQATYYRRFLLLRKFLRWVSQRESVRDPFVDLEPPPKPRQERDWLTLEEFRLLLDAAGRPARNLPGLAERDRLALLALVTTGLRRSELCSLEWRDLELNGRKPSLLVRHRRGGKSRRQPLAVRLAHELLKLRDARQPAPTDPVFCGLVGGRLQETILADRGLKTHHAAEQRAALSASQASRSCSLAGAGRGATVTLPSKTSGPRKAFISLSWERWRSICASMRTAAAYSAGSRGRSPGSRRSRIRSAAHQ
jgi:integrase